MVIEHANGPYAKNVRRIHSLLPAQRVEFAVFARIGVVVVPRTIRTVHTRLKIMVLGVLCFVTWQVAAPKITFQGGAFLVSGALGSEIVPVGQNKKMGDPVDRVKGRFQLSVGSKTVTFDAKGLTISQKGLTVTTKLKAVPTSGKIATKESNAELMAQVAEKKRKLEVSALSGWQLIDKTLYILARWEGSDKKPWLEALLKIKLDDKRPQPSLVGRFDGFSFATGPVDDVLFLRGDKLAVLTDSKGKFGLSSMATDSTDIEHIELGDAVGKAKAMENNSKAWTLTATRYGTNVLGIADLDKGTYSVLGEVRGKMIGITAPAFARYQSGGSTMVTNLLTGAVVKVEQNSKEAQGVNGILIWSPAQNPVKAALYDSSFRRLAVWAAPPIPVAVKPAAVSKPVPTKPKATKTIAKPKIGVKPVKKPAVKPKAKPKVKIEVSSRPSKKKKTG